ncbi:hypothetical protein [Microvirga pudoricolor]|uniref:hypothetical protein n=1 Tax=Microvirga pudoricolor TaxID=2778729 RepID=UPI001951CB7E|nr:hypothetical protein [Microvirga pudoricolor]MBM6594642.1 hypothetical protein [Microvirga pudoricolor]
MRPNFLIIGLLVLIAVVGIYMSSDPGQSERLSQMYRDAAFQGEAREYVLFALAVGIGGFILYLTMTRR